MVEKRIFPAVLSKDETAALVELHNNTGGEFKRETTAAQIKEALKMGNISRTDAIKAIFAILRGDSQKPINPIPEERLK